MKKVLGLCCFLLIGQHLFSAAVAPAEEENTKSLIYGPHNVVFIEDEALLLQALREAGKLGFVKTRKWSKNEKHCGLTFDRIALVGRDLTEKEIRAGKKKVEGCRQLLIVKKVETFSFKESFYFSLSAREEVRFLSLAILSYQFGSSAYKKISGFHVDYWETVPGLDDGFIYFYPGSTLKKITFARDEEKVFGRFLLKAMKGERHALQKRISSKKETPRSKACFCWPFGKRRAAGSVSSSPRSSVGYPPEVREAWGDDDA